ncbi:MAG: hypothetical protein INH41_06520 [Myxococcaceae bacterium]|nr:hypothetical protein [Myxococcaceae bacterium]MCA3012043.1 hypothetical protein [Myxococcaceae bacterium]
MQFVVAPPSTAPATGAVLVTAVALSVPATVTSLSSVMRRPPPDEVFPAMTRARCAALSFAMSMLPAPGVTAAESTYGNPSQVAAIPPSTERVPLSAALPLMRTGAATGPTFCSSQSTSCWVLPLTSEASAGESAQKVRKGAGSVCAQLAWAHATVERASQTPSTSAAATTTSAPLGRAGEARAPASSPARYAERHRSTSASDTPWRRATSPGLVRPARSSMMET